MGRAGTRAGLCQGCWAPLDPVPGGPSCPQGPQALGANVPPDCPCLRRSPIRGAFRIQWRHRLEGWVSGGAGLVLESWALLPAAGPACALLHRAGAKQGSEGAIGWGATTLHFEVGSQGGILAGAPLRGGQGIWKESRRVGLGGAFASHCPARIGLSTHAFAHSLTHSFIHPSTNADQGWAPDPEEVPVTTLPPGRTWKPHSKREARPCRAL